MSLSVDVLVQRKLFTDVRSLEAVEFAVLLDQSAARTVQVYGDVAEHAAVQTTMLSDSPS